MTVRLKDVLKAGSSRSVLQGHLALEAMLAERSSRDGEAEVRVAVEEDGGNAGFHEDRSALFDDSYQGVRIEERRWLRTRGDDGRRIAKGHPSGKIIEIVSVTLTDEDTGRIISSYERSLHATKGWRSRRVD